jgi:photosystem II stability/assembly factor-like uncharacterized protein
VLIIGAISVQAQSEFWSKTPWGTGSLSHMTVKNDSVYVASGNEIRMSTNKGETWTTLKSQTTSELVTRVFVTNNSTVIFGRAALSAGKQFFIKRSGQSTWDSTFDASAAEMVTSFAQTTNGNLFAGLLHYIMGTGGVYVSTDNGISWTKKGTSLGGILSLLADGNTIYAGSTAGRLWKSTDAGDNWTEVENLSQGILSLIKFGSNFFAGTSQRLYKSTGNDDNWAQLTNFAVQDSVLSLLGVSGSTNFIYAGTKENEVWRSSNDGTSWSKISTGLNNDKRVWRIALLSNDTLMLGQDDGTYKSNYQATYNPPPPNAPTSLAAQSDSLKITLTWTDNQSDVTYSVFRKEGPTGSYPVIPLAEGLTDKSYVDNILRSRSKTRYYYVVVAVQPVTGEKSSNSNEVNGKSTWEEPEPPQEPQNLTATGGNATVALSWGTVTGTNISYRVYRATTSNGYNMTSPLVSDLISNSYNDNSVANGTTYFYVVKSYNDSTKLISTMTSNEVSTTPRKPDPQPATALQVSVSDPDVVLTWTLSPTGDITHYRIYQSSIQGTGYVQIDSVVGTQNTFTFTPQRDRTFYYVVKAWDAVHESQPTNEVSARLETLELFMEVSPSSRYRVDQGFAVSYEIRIKDQANKTDVYNVEIINGVSGQTDNIQTNASGYFKYDFQVPTDKVFGDYNVGFTATKQNYASATTDRPVTVVGIPRASNDWAVIYQESGKPVLMFAMADTNNKWQYPGIPGKLRSAGKDVLINDYLRFVGDSVEVDTNARILRSWNGEWSVLSPTKHIIFTGNDEMTMAYGSGNSLTFTYPDALLENSTKLFGVTLYPDNVSFNGGVLASGMNMNGLFTLKGVMANCENPVPEINFKGFVFTENGINMVGATLPQLSPDPTACFENFTMQYQAGSNRLDLYGDFSIPWLTIRGYAKIENGQFETVELNASGMATEVGKTGLTILNAKGLATGITLPPMEMTLEGTLLSKSFDFLEVDFDGYVDFPQKIRFQSSESRIINESTNGNWQIVGPMQGTLNVSTHLDLNGDVKAGLISANNYIFDGSGDLKYFWKPEERLRGGMKGEVTVTDFPNQFPFDLIELFWDGSFPIKLNNAQVYAVDKKVKGNLHFGNNIGTLNFTLNLDKNYGDQGFFEIGTGAINMNGMIRKNRGKGEQVQAYDPYKLEGQSLPIMIKKDGTQAINSNDTLNLTGGMDKVFIRIMSDTQVPGSYLIDPGGTKHTETDIKDTANIAFKKTSSSQKGYWVIKGDFAEGDWITGTNPEETKAQDMRDVFATFDSRDLDLAITKTGNTVGVEWNATAVPDGPYVEFYLALDTNDTHGLLIGTTDEKDGEFTFTLSDSLPECMYYLYALRYDNDVIDRYYSTEELWNNKGSLMTPGLTSAVYFGGTKKLVVRWDDPNTTEIQGYLIRLTYEDGKQEIVARPYAGSTEIEIDFDIDLEQTTILKIEIAAYTKEGWESCWSTIADVVLDVNDYPLAGFTSENDRLSIFPNPMGNSTNIRFKVVDNSNIKIRIFNVLGTEIMNLTNEFYSTGIYDIPLKSEGIANGTYYIKYESNDVLITKLLIINK